MKRNLSTWWRWFLGKHRWEELPEQTDPLRFSVILLLCGMGFGVLRRLSLHEHIKHFFWDPLSDDEGRWVPARFVDAFLLVEAAILIGCYLFVPASLPGRTPLVLGLVAVFIIVQKVQTNLFHLVWRQTLKGGRRGKPHNNVRNAVLATWAFFEVVLLFGLVYWWLCPMGFRPELQCPTDGLYASLVYAATLGPSGDLPDIAQGAVVARRLQMLEIVSTLVMLAIVVARALAVIQPPRGGSVD